MLGHMWDVIKGLRQRSVPSGWRTSPGDDEAMKRKALVLAGAAILVAVMFVFVLPSIDQRCETWYHRVAFISFHQDLTRDEAIEQVGAKPFYCS